MAENRRWHVTSSPWLSLISFGFFLILLGAIWFITPNISAAVENFVGDFQLRKVAGDVSLPAPGSDHPVLYNAAMQFCLVFGVFQIVILALRFVFRDSVERKAETVSGVVFWLGVAVFLGLLANGSLGWFSFIAGFVVSVGLSVVARNIVRLFRRQSSTDERI
jgi:hypothetical protein